MAPRRWSTGHVVAIVEAVCAVVAAGYLVVIGVTSELLGTPGRTVLDRTFPFLAAAVVLALLGGWAIRSLRTARREQPAPTGRVPEHGPPPTLSESGRDTVAAIVTILADAGIFRPHVPDPGDLEPAVADHGEPVSATGVLSALHETDYWRPGFRIEDHTAALAFDASHAEQDAASLRRQIRDLSRLAGDDVPVEVEDIDVTWAHGARASRTRVRMTVGGQPLVLDYAGAAKRSSSIIPVAVARALRAAGASVRLAWLWGDQGFWATVLPTGFDLDGLNSAVVAVAGTVGDAPGDEWEWVDEQEPNAAGEGA